VTGLYVPQLFVTADVHALSSSTLAEPQMLDAQVLSTRWPWQLVSGESHTAAAPYDAGQFAATPQHAPVEALQQ